MKRTAPWLLMTLPLIWPLGSCAPTEGELELRVGGTGATEKALELEVRGITLRSGSGEPWSARDMAEVLEVEGEARASIGHARMPVGAYDSVKVELGPVFVITMEDGSLVTREWPDILMYIKGGAYLHATEENGFERSNRYFVFSVDNGMLEAPVMIDGEQGEVTLALLFEPRYPELDSVGSRAALASQLVLER